MQKKQGYTLIEMLLVIAIISILAAAFLLTYRTHAATARVNKASLEVQQVLQAAMTYQVDEGAWPDATAAPPTCTPPNLTQNKFVQNYLPNQDYVSSFGNNYCWSETKTSNNHTPTFWVALKSPNNDSNFATRVASRLPNAVVTSDPTQTPATPCVAGQACYVRAEVPRPSGSGGSSHAFVIAIGNCKPGVKNNTDCPDTAVVSGQPKKYTATFPACPTNYSPVGIATLNFLKMPTGNSRGAFFDRDSTQVTSCKSDPTTGKGSCEIVVSVGTCTRASKPCNSVEIFGLPSGNAGASYVITCKPNQNQPLALRRW